MICAKSLMAKIPLDESNNILSSTGLILIIIGIALFLIPSLLKYYPSIEAIGKIHWLILYVYRSDNFVFATSPILILASLVFIIYSAINK